MAKTITNLTKVGAVMEAVVSKTKGKLEREIDDEIAKLVEKMKVKKIEILAGVSLEFEEMVRVDQCGNDFFLVIKEKE